MESEYVQAGITFRPNRLNKGKNCGGHDHNFDHSTLIFAGSFHATARRPLFNTDGTPMLDNNGDQATIVEFERDVYAGTSLLIKAEWWHNFVALEDDSRFVCLFPSRDPVTGKIVPEWNGWVDATT